MVIANTYLKKKKNYWERIKAKDSFNLEFPPSKHTQTQMRVEGESLRENQKCETRFFFLQLCDVMLGTH